MCCWRCTWPAWPCCSARSPCRRWSDRRIVPAIFHAASAQLITGLALVGVNEADDRDLDHAKVADETG